MGVPDQAIARSAKSNIFATHLTDGKTNVRVNTSFSMEIRTGNGSHVFPYQDQWKQAHSNGNVERTVLNEIQYRIGAQHSASEIGRSVSVFVPGRRSTAFTKIRT